MYEHTLRIPLVAAGPGIPPGVMLSYLGTNVDLAPTFLEFAGLEAPVYMDGRSIVPFLIPDPEHPAVRNTATAALLRKRRRQQQLGPLQFRNESFFQYYNAGPWSPGNGGDECPVCTAGSCSVPGNICPGLNCSIRALQQAKGKGFGNCTVRKLDDESNTYIGITTHPEAAVGFWKLAEFQNSCDAQQLDPATPSCFNDLTMTELFDLKNDPYELTNVIASAPPAVVRELRARLRRFYPCKGASCP